MKRILSVILFFAVVLFGISEPVMAQVPTIVVAPIPATCSGTNSTLHYSATNSPTSYSINWYGSPAGLPDVGAGTALPAPNIPIVVLGTCTAGTYYGDLTISNSIGASAPTAISVTVYNLPAAYTVTGGGNYCIGGSGVHVGISGSEVGVLYQLYRGGVGSGSSVWGTGSAIDFGLQTLTGTYTVGAHNVTTTCNNSMTGSVTVGTNPVPGVVSVTGGGGFCIGSAGVPVGLSASAFGTYYRLYRGGAPLGSPLAGIGMALDFGVQTVPGTYTVVAVDSAGPCLSNMSGSASVYNYPNPSVYNVTGGGSYCVGGFGVDVGLNGSNTGINYKLYRGASVAATMSGTGAPLDFGLIVPDGSYTVRAINSVYGCTAHMLDTAYITYIPDTTPSVSIHGSKGTTICSGVIDTFKAITVYGGTAPAYTWELNGTFVGYGNTFTYTPANGDHLKVTLTSNVTCALPNIVNDAIFMTVKGKIIPTVVVNAYPGPNIVNGTSVTMSAVIINGGTAPVYQWYVNGVLAAGANTPSFTTSAFANNDSVTCWVYGCNDTPGHASMIIHVTPRVGIDEINAGNNSIRIVPNPNKGSFTIGGTIADGHDAAIKITDVLGKVVYTDYVPVADGKIDAKVQLPGTLSPGLYLLNLRTGSDNFFSKIIVE